MKVYILVAYSKDVYDVDHMAGNLAVYSTMEAAQRQIDRYDGAIGQGNFDIEEHEIDADPEMDR